MFYPKEPTGEQCSNCELVFSDESNEYYACWYPQMGGYFGKAVAVFDKEWFEDENGISVGGCVDVYVWHDGEFPFSDSNPAFLHHCSGLQFVEFGDFLESVNNRNLRKNKED